MSQYLNYSFNIKAFLEYQCTNVCVLKHLYILHFRYNAMEYYEKLPELKRCIDQIKCGYFSPQNVDQFKDVVDVLLKYDR